MPPLYDAANRLGPSPQASRHPCLASAMARADLLIDIVRPGAEGNHGLFRSALEALITEVRFKQHYVLADLRLETFPAAAGGSAPSRGHPPGLCAHNLEPCYASFPSTTILLHKGWRPAT
jgi:hypothetical protein